MVCCSLVCLPFYRLSTSHPRCSVCAPISRRNPGQTDTVANDRIRRYRTVYLSPYYDRVSPCLIRRNMAICGAKNDHMQSLYMEPVHDLHFTSCFFIYDRFSAYTVTEIYDRNAGTGNTTKYDRIRQ